MPHYNAHTFHVLVGPVGVVPYGASASEPHHPPAVLSTTEEPYNPNLLTLRPSPTPSNASSVAHPTHTSPHARTARLTSSPSAHAFISIYISLMHISDTSTTNDPHPLLEQSMYAPSFRNNGLYMKM